MTEKQVRLRRLGDFFWRLAVLALLTHIAAAVAKDSKFWSGYVLVLFFAGVGGLLVFSNREAK